MVKKTRFDSMGNIYKRVDAVTLTCPVCGQDVDPSHSENFVVDPTTEKPVHKGCVLRLQELMSAEQGKIL